MFKFEKDMIPVLIESLSKLYGTNYFVKEFQTGNGIADIVFTTRLNSEPLVLGDYGMMSIFVSHINGKSSVHKKEIFSKYSDKVKTRKLFSMLEESECIKCDDLVCTPHRGYKPHTENLISIEAKLKDWKSGFYQALRYKFYSQKSFLAISKQYLHRVDTTLLISNNIGLISVCSDSIDIVVDPTVTSPIDCISYFHLSEAFATKCRNPY